MSAKGKFVLFLSVLSLLLIIAIIFGSTIIGISNSILSVMADILGWTLVVIIIAILGTRLFKLLFLFTVFDLAVYAISYLVIGDFVAAIVAALLVALMIPLLVRWVFKRV